MPLRLLTFRLMRLTHAFRDQLSNPSGSFLPVGLSEMGRRERKVGPTGHTYALLAPNQSPRIDCSVARGFHACAARANAVSFLIRP